MTLEELVTLLRSVGVDENTVTAMTNAYDLGYVQAIKEQQVLSNTLQGVTHEGI